MEYLKRMTELAHRLDAHDLWEAVHLDGHLPALQPGKTNTGWLGPSIHQPTPEPGKTGGNLDVENPPGGENISVPSVFGKERSAGEWRFTQWGTPESATFPDIKAQVREALEEHRQDELDHFRGRADSQGDQIARLIERNNSIGADRDRLKAEVETLDELRLSRPKTLRLLCEELGLQWGADGVVRVVADELKRLKVENDELDRQVLSARGSLDVLKAENETLTALLAGAEDRTKIVLDSRRRALDENERLRAQLSEAERALSRWVNGPGAPRASTPDEGAMLRKLPDEVPIVADPAAEYQQCWRILDNLCLVYGLGEHPNSVREGIKELSDEILKLRATHKCDKCTDPELARVTRERDGALEAHKNCLAAYETRGRVLESMRAQIDAQWPSTANELDREAAAKQGRDRMQQRGTVRRKW